MEGVSLGQHLTPPEGCPDVIKSLMLSCWQHFPTDRISFSEIVKTLAEDNSKIVMENSNSLYAQGCPLDYNQKYRLSMTKHNEKRQTDLVKNPNDKITEISSPRFKSDNIVFVDSKHISIPLLTELPDITLSPCIETETQYTIILANDQGETEHECQSQK